MDKVVPARFFIIFTISGFAGLIYESIWSHYLKLFLGHAAYAQTLVLAIFMGGMAIGAWLCSRYASRWRNLLLMYAAVEGFIGILSLVFHDVFQSSIQLAYDVVIPSLATPLSIDLFKWSLSAVLILPQSILLGMTFPLMSAGLIRAYPQFIGRSIAMLYFTNSIGAVFGVLASGFLLIEMVGLPGTIQIAGTMNIILAMIVFWYARSPDYSQSDQATKSLSKNPAGNSWYYVLLGVALLTGMASFMYEIAWIRMLSLVLGSSTHAFELMLSAFILGLALGGLWIKSRIDRIQQPEWFLGKVQVIMGLLALATLPLYNLSFDYMQWLVSVLDKTQTGFTLFNISSHLIALAVMLPATLCAGVTLPLITYSLMHKKFGEQCIGAVYASNTVGAILGVVLAIHIGLPMLGLKGLLILGAGIDILVGIYLLVFLRSMQSAPRFAAWAVVGLSGLAFTYFFVQMDLYKMGSGVYRVGHLLDPENIEILYHKDGKSATIDLQRFNKEYITIRANGKADAAISMADGVISSDEPTMVLAAAIPLAFNPASISSAVIGMGSGLSSQTLLSSPNMQSVDTIEIEPAMVEAAQGFRPRVELTFSDPRSHIYIDDAKTYFSSHNKRYDIILSEPSNPWVSGTASLFTDEFYKMMPRYLTEQGILAQWIQLYELNEELVACIVKALTTHFDDYAIYIANERDMLIIAKANGSLGSPRADLFELQPLRDELEKIYVKSLGDINIRRIGSKKVLDPLFASYNIPANSDYYPVLDVGAARTRYLQHDAGALVGLSYSYLPVFDILEGQRNNYEQLNDLARLTTAKAEYVRQANRMANHFLESSLPNEKPLDSSLMTYIDYTDRLKYNSHICESTVDKQWLDDLLVFAKQTIPFLSPATLDLVWGNMTLSACHAKLDVNQLQWLALFKAISHQQIEPIASIATALLKNSNHSERQQEYLLSTAMLGNLALNNKAQARKLWETYGASIEPDKNHELMHRLLLVNTQ